MARPWHAAIADGVKRFLKAELKRPDVTYAELAERLKKHALKETEASITSKLNRGTFAATFLLACLAALELEGMRLEDRIVNHDIIPGGIKPKLKPKKTQKQPSADQRGTEQSPLVINQIPTETSEAERAQKTKADTEKTGLDRKLVSFNGDLAYYTEILAIVAIFQFVVLFVQAIVLVLSLRAAEKAANAAKDFADALPAIERAYIFVVPRIRPIVLAEGGIGVHYYCIKHGKTPAVIDGIEVHFSPLASPPDNTSFLTNIPEANGSVIGAGERWPLDQSTIINPQVRVASIEDAITESD